MTKLYFFFIILRKDCHCCEKDARVHFQRSCSKEKRPSSSSEVDFGLCKYFSSSENLLPVCCDADDVASFQTLEIICFPFIDSSPHANHVELVWEDFLPSKKSNPGVKREARSPGRAISTTKDSSIVYHLGKLADTQKASNNRTPIAPFSYLHYQDHQLWSLVLVCLRSRRASLSNNSCPFNVFLLRFGRLHVQLKRCVAFPVD